jgi:site-specific DNA-methyltransferase (adenine-specific)
MPDASVDAVITDPPYSSGGFTRGDRSASTTAKYTLTGTQIERPAFAGDNRDQRSFGYRCALWLSECLRVAKTGAPIAVFTDWRQLPTMTDAIQAAGSGDLWARRPLHD